MRAGLAAKTEAEARFAKDVTARLKEAGLIGDTIEETAERLRNAMVADSLPDGVSPRRVATTGCAWFLPSFGSRRPGPPRRIDPWPSPGAVDWQRGSPEGAVPQAVGARRSKARCLTPCGHPR